MFSFIGGLVVGAILGFIADMFLMRGRYEAEAEALRQQLNESRDKTRALQRDVDTHMANTKTLQARLDTAQQKVTVLQGDADGRSADAAALRTEVSRLQAQLDSQTGMAADLNAQAAAAQAEIVTLRARLSALEGEKGQLEAQLAECEALRQELTSAETDLAEVRTQLAHVTADVGEPDDLQRIEGIGPKISSTLNAAGITTFRRLAASSVEELADILRAAGISRISDPSTWSQQASLAAAGEWETLEKLQDSLKGGRR